MENLCKLFYSNRSAHTHITYYYYYDALAICYGSMCDEHKDGGDASSFFVATKTRLVASWAFFGNITLICKKALKNIEAIKKLRESFCEFMVESRWSSTQLILDFDNFIVKKGSFAIFIQKPTQQKGERMRERANKVYRSRCKFSQTYKKARQRNRHKNYYSHYWYSGRW